MRTLFYGAAIFVSVSAPALAAEKPTVEPNKLTVETQRPPLTLNDQQRATIEQALATENTEQKTPPKFEPKVGATLPLSMTVDVMPQRLVREQPSLEPYGYAKLAKDVLVIDPMKKSIVAVIPRRQPTSGKDVKPDDWAKTRGRELTGQAPEPTTGQDTSPEPAGDSGDKKNGNEKNANEK